MAKLELPSYLETFLFCTKYISDKLVVLLGLLRSTYFSWFDDSGNLKSPKDRSLKNPKMVSDSETKLDIE